ncbi:MAG TPA: diacylglycerol kinase family protein [Polyangiaceae bacterium]|jgi:diacylglycerol kinase family enzyme
MAQHAAGQVNVDLILNRRARHLREGSALRDLLAAEARRAGVHVHETSTLAELDEVARALATRGSDAVVLAGGDGSVMGGFSALARAWTGALPAVVLAPGGTVATIAHNLGVHGEARAWARRAIAAPFRPDPRVVQHATLHVTDDAGGDRVGFIFGAGLVARFFQEYYGAKDPGLAAAAGLAARVFAGSIAGSSLAGRVLSPVGSALEVDGVAQAGHAWSLVLASVLRDVGLHVRATYRAGDEPGRFHVVASGLPPRGLAREFHRVLTGRPMRGEPRVDALAASLRLRFDEEGSYVLDGDLVPAREVRLAPGPSVRFLAP